METNHGPRRPVPAVCRIFCCNVPGLARNLSDLTVASSRYDILLCSESLVSDMHHASEVLVNSLFWSPFLVVSRQDASDPWDGCIRSRWSRSISPTQICVWLFRNAVFGGLWCETEYSLTIQNTNAVFMTVQSTVFIDP